MTKTQQNNIFDESNVVIFFTVNSKSWNTVENTGSSIIYALRVVFLPKKKNEWMARVSGGQWVQVYDGEDINLILPLHIPVIPRTAWLANWTF